jgi:hypothetical protein
MHAALWQMIWHSQVPAFHSCPDGHFPVGHVLTGSHGHQLYPPQPFDCWPPQWVMSHAFGWQQLATVTGHAWERASQRGAA